MVLLISVILVAGCVSSTVTPTDASYQVQPATTTQPPTIESQDATYASHITLAIDYLNNPTVHNFALQQVQHSSAGYYNIAQICDVWQTMYNQWTYVSDPPNFDYWTSASDSINNGLKGNCADYATLNAAVIESIGGSSRVVTACAPGGSPCHAYAEVYLGDTQSDLQTATDYICSRYTCGSNGRGISYHPYTDAQGNTEYWLNLDWSANFPGGPFFQDDGTYHVFYPDGSYYDTTCSGGTPCTITEKMNVQSPLVAPTIVEPTSNPTLTLLTVQTPTPNTNLGPTYPITIINDLVNIPEDSYRYYSFNSNSGNTYHVSIGADLPIDILIMDQSNFNIYKNGFMSGSNGVTYYAVRYNSVTSEDFDYIPPDSGTYYVVIEKTPTISLNSGANAKTSVLASTKILLTGNS